VVAGRGMALRSMFAYVDNSYPPPFVRYDWGKDEGASVEGRSCVDRERINHLRRSLSFLFSHIVEEEIRNFIML
jgi:hypothetical protein